MAFMTPEYSNEDFWCVETPDGDIYIPDQAVDVEYSDAPKTLIQGKWFCRLSARGYLDCTDWSGPFDSEEEARIYIEITYDVDQDTGEYLDC